MSAMYEPCKQNGFRKLSTVAQNLGFFSGRGVYGRGVWLMPQCFQLGIKDGSNLILS